MEHDTSLVDRRSLMKFWGLVNNYFMTQYDASIQQRQRGKNAT